MDLKRYLLPVGIFLAVVIAFFTLKSIFFKDVIKPKLGKLLITNQQMTALSGEASSNLENFDLKITASNVNAVISSDNLILTDYYRRNYGKKIPTSKASDPLKKLEESPSGAAYDETYRRLLRELRNSNVELAHSLMVDSKSDELDNMLENYVQHLTLLFEKIN